MEEVKHIKGTLFWLKNLSEFSFKKNHQTQSLKNVKKFLSSMERAQKKSSKEFTLLKACF